ncbi:MAG TPA: amidohydrolase, partial [Porticoccaceae bacterium]|nr:amidohydrolase [Porticoccaceae bacterium]
MKIDAHQHFWVLARGDYTWLKPELGTIYRDYTPSDLLPLIERHRIDGTVLVQAAPTLEETVFMLDLAASNTFVKGVVGWVDFNAPEAQGVIEWLAENPVLVGLRPMIQDIPEADWMLSPELKGVFSALIAQNLTFDALTLPQHLPSLKELLVRYPQMRVVIDHGSKPRIRENKFGQWAKSMADISRNTVAFCKLSGLVTEASRDWLVEDLKPYV